MYLVDITCSRKLTKGKPRWLGSHGELGCGYGELRCGHSGRLPLPLEGHLVGMRLDHSMSSHQGLPQCQDRSFQERYSTLPGRSVLIPAIQKPLFYSVWRHHHQRGHKSFLTSYLYSKERSHLLLRPGMFRRLNSFRSCRKSSGRCRKPWETDTPWTEGQRSYESGILQAPPHHSPPLLPLPHSVPIPRIL